MTISVIIPAYKAARTIRRAVDSVLQQTLLPTEILVIDDGSPDRAELISALEPYGKAVRRIEKANGGVASARNLGIQSATGEWIAFLDADDFWEANKLEVQFAAAQCHPEASVIGSRWYVQFPGGQPVPDRARTADYAGRVVNVRGPEAFLIATCIWTGSLMIRRSVLLSAQFRSRLEPAEDRDLWFRLLHRYAAYICPEFLATYVQEPGGISRANIARDCERMLEVIRSHADLLGSHMTARQSAIVYRRWAAEHLGSGHPELALAPAWKRFTLEPWRLQAWWIVFKSSYRTLLATAIKTLRGHSAMQTVDTTN